MAEIGAADADLEYQIDTQTTWLAAHTRLSTRQAEALIRRDAQELPQTTLAERMGINPSTFSNHLSAAEKAIDAEGLVTDYWLFRGPGPVSPSCFRKSHQWTDRNHTIVIYQRAVYGHNLHAPGCFVIHEYPDRDANASAEIDRMRTVVDRYEFDSPADLRDGLLEDIEFEDAEHKSRTKAVLDEEFFSSGAGGLEEMWDETTDDTLI